MIFLILAVIITATCFGVYSRSINPMTIGETVALLAITVVVALIINVFTMLIPTGEVTTRSNPIVSLSDNTGMSGSFFLGSGSIGNSPYYSYYMETTNGIQLVNDPADYNTYIKFDKSAPHVVIYDEVTGNKWWSLWTLSTEDHRVFHIPAGSITTKFVLDAH